MTTILQDEKSSLPVDYIDEIKLFHAQTYFPKLGLETTVDVDANMNPRNAYYFEGAILPSLYLTSANSYFSVQPETAVSLVILLFGENWVLS